MDSDNWDYVYAANILEGLASVIPMDAVAETIFDLVRGWCFNARRAYFDAMGVEVSFNWRYQQYRNCFEIAPK
jgi:hypothetical protein